MSESLSRLQLLQILRDRGEIDKHPNLKAELSSLEAVQSAAEPPKPTFRGAQGDVFSAMNGMMFGFGDEAAALGTAAGSKLGVFDKGITYDKALGDIRQMKKGFDESNPYRSLGSEVGGGLLGLLATRGLPVIGMGNAAARGAGAVARMASAAKQGAAVGALSGFGSGEGGVNNRVGSAALGGGLGGLLGAGLQGVVETPNAALRLGDILGITNSDKAASRTIKRTLERTGRTPADLLGEMRSSQAPLSLIDVGGNPTLEAGRAIVTKGGAGADIGIKALQERSLGRGNRVVSLSRQNISPMDDSMLAIDDLAKSRSALGRSDYEAAMSVVPKISPELERMLKDPLATKGLSQGNEVQRILAASENKPFTPQDIITTDAVKQISPSYSERSAGAARSVVEQQKSLQPNMESLQAVKIGLDNMLDSYRDPLTKELVLDQRGRAINEFRKRYLEELNKANPLFAKANETWGDYSSLMDAAATGGKFMRGDVDLATRAVNALTPAEKAMYRIGAAREIRRIVERTRDGNDALGKIFGSPESRDRIKLLFDDDASFNNLRKQIEDEMLAARNEAKILGGSQTTNKAEEVSNVFGQIPKADSNFMSRIPQGLLNLIGNESRLRQGERMAPVLFGTDANEVEKLLAAKYRGLLSPPPSVAIPQSFGLFRNLASSRVGEQK